MEDHFDDAVGSDPLRWAEILGSLELEAPKEANVGLKQWRWCKLEVSHRPTLREVYSAAGAFANGLC